MENQKDNEMNITLKGLDFFAGARDFWSGLM